MFTNGSLRHGSYYNSFYYSTGSSVQLDLLSTRLNFDNYAYLEFISSTNFYAYFAQADACLIQLIFMQHFPNYQLLSSLILYRIKEFLLEN